MSEDDDYLFENLETALNLINETDRKLANEPFLTEKDRQALVMETETIEFIRARVHFEKLASADLIAMFERYLKILEDLHIDRARRRDNDWRTTARELGVADGLREARDATDRLFVLVARPVSLSDKECGAGDGQPAQQHEQDL